MSLDYSTGIDRPTVFPFDGASSGSREHQNQRLHEEWHDSLQGLSHEDLQRPFLWRPEANQDHLPEFVVYTAPTAEQFATQWSKGIGDARDKAVNSLAASDRVKVDAKALDQVGKILERVGSQIAKGSLSDQDVKDLQGALKDLDLKGQTNFAAGVMMIQFNRQMEKDFGVRVDIKFQADEHGPKAITFGQAHLGGNSYQTIRIAEGEKQAEAYLAYKGVAGPGKNASTVAEVMPGLKTLTGIKP